MTKKCWKKTKLSNISRKDCPWRDYRCSWRFYRFWEATVSLSETSATTERNNRVEWETVVDPTKTQVGGARCVFSWAVRCDNCFPKHSTTRWLSVAVTPFASIYPIYIYLSLRSGSASRRSLPRWDFYALQIWTGFSPDLVRSGWKMEQNWPDLGLTWLGPGVTWNETGWNYWNLRYQE